MADSYDLVGLALAAMGSTESQERVGVADAVEALPEGSGRAPVPRPPDDLAQYAVDDPSAPLATELELVARVVNRPRAIGFHPDAVFDAGDQLVE